MAMRIIIAFCLAVGVQSCMIHNPIRQESSAAVCTDTENAFLTKLVFTRETGGVRFHFDGGSASACTKKGCCLKELGAADSTFQIDSSYPSKLDVGVGEQVEKKNYWLECKNSYPPDVKLICEETGWNVIRLSNKGELCICPRGQYLTSTNNEVTCKHCPAGHTTYKTSPNTCTGPEIVATNRRKQHLFTARVPYNDIGGMTKLARFWSSTGNWNLAKENGKTFSQIKQESTSTYITRPRVVHKNIITVAIEPIIEDVFCYRIGGQYQGYANTTTSGDCKPGGQSDCKYALGKLVCYCTGSPPTCNTTQGEKSCDVPQCTSHSGVPSPCNYDEEYGVSFEANAMTWDDLDEAKRICDMLGGDCSGVARSESSSAWTVLGTSPIRGTGTGTYHEKDSACGNPYDEYYFNQSWAD